MGLGLAVGAMECQLSQHMSVMEASVAQALGWGVESPSKLLQVVVVWLQAWEVPTVVEVAVVPRAAMVLVVAAAREAGFPAGGGGGVLPFRRRNRRFLVVTL